MDHIVQQSFSKIFSLLWLEAPAQLQESRQEKCPSSVHMLKLLSFIPLKAFALFYSTPIELNAYHLRFLSVSFLKAAATPGFPLDISI